MGWLFIAVFEIYLFGNTIYLVMIVLNQIHLRLKKRYTESLRKQLAREVISQIKLINQVLFAQEELNRQQGDETD